MIGERVSDVVEIPSALLHFLMLTPSVVVLVENSRCHVRTIADDVFRNIIVQVVSDSTTSKGVWTDA